MSEHFSYYTAATAAALHFAFHFLFRIQYRMVRMAAPKSLVCAALTATILAAAYLLLPSLSPPKLKFEDRTFPRGFRDLVLDGTSSRFDPPVGLQTPLASSTSKLDAQVVCDSCFETPILRCLKILTVIYKLWCFQIIAVLTARNSPPFCPKCRETTSALCTRNGRSWVTARY
jgi:hypothetical protein